MSPLGARTDGQSTNERQYSAEDPGGHIWTFSESIADVDPAELGWNPEGVSGVEEADATSKGARS